MKKTITLCLAAVLAASPVLSAKDILIQEGAWTIEMPQSTRTMTISYNGTPVFNKVYASVYFNHVGESDATALSSIRVQVLPEVRVEDMSDELGSGRSYTLVYTVGTVEMRQRFTFYPEHPYMIAQAEIASLDDRLIESNNLVPIAVNASSDPFKGDNNQIVWVPYDNDGYVKYEIRFMGNSTEKVSHEVSYAFDGDSRYGLIAGSIDHDKWKSGVNIAGSNGKTLDKFTLQSGYTSSTTRDKLGHGKVKGSTVSSSRFLVGFYDDWRAGMDEYGATNALVAPPAKWEKGNPMGWNSWGVQQSSVSYDGVYDTAEFIKNYLYDLGFHDNNGQTVISLDSFATDNIPSYRLYNLATKVFSDGEYREGTVTKQGFNMVLGQYLSPLTAYEWTLESKVPGTGINGVPSCTFNDIALKVNGSVYKMPSNVGYAIDGSHPGTHAYIRYMIQEVAANGTRYVKCDFLNNGAVEGDSYYDPNVTTGVQSYNSAMKVLLEECEKYGIYIAESIAPIFPYQYAHGRRTCCDRFSTISETEYVMNSISYGWWTDKLYTVNDADHLVMCKRGNGAKETLGENRARATSGVVAGAYLFGDNFSNAVNAGYPETSRDRALTIMGNAEINDYVRNHTGSFMPVYGDRYTSSQMAESVFMRRLKDQMYVAVFNFSSNASHLVLPLKNLGITEDDEITEIKELWFGAQTDLADVGEYIAYTIPAKDARIYRITFAEKEEDGIADAVVDTDTKGISIAKIGLHRFAVSAVAGISSCQVYDLYGKYVAEFTPCGDTDLFVDLESATPGVYVINVTLENGTTRAEKVINN